MRKLHLVGYTPDLEGLIFTARRGSKSGGYVVAIEDGLVDTIDEARRRRNGDTASNEPATATRDATGSARSNRSESTLTPREIQARLRSGRSIAQVAAEARVDPEWVERFAVPILAEQAQIVELAKASTYSKPRLGPSSQPLGPSVAWNLADRGVQFPDEVLSAAWTAHQVHDTLWRVRLAYRSRGRSQDAVWELDIQTAQLVARNRLASELAHIEKGRRRRSVSRLRSGGGDAETDDDEPTTKPARKRSTGPAKRPAARKPAARTAVARKVVARKGVARKPPAKKAAGAVKARRSTAAAKARPASVVKARTVRKVAKSSKAAKVSKPAKAKASKAKTKRAVKANAVAAPPEPARTINRVASSKVAASRAKANRLSGDRAVGNTLTPEEPRFLSREISRRPPVSSASKPPKAAPTASPRAEAKENPRPNRAPVIDLDALLDDTPAPPPPAHSLHQRTSRPARSLFGVRPSPAPAG
ncbi:MAG TPA: septation protein SepH [Acidimicrobiales bacterium]|nr:septation protein SepH [Acidimicrobiales bacterium]